MTRRDLAWRALGAATIAAACAVAALGNAGVGAAPSMGLLSFVLAILGLTVIIQGDRIPRALRVETSRHRDLPTALSRRRRARRGGDVEPS